MTQPTKGGEAAAPNELGGEKSVHGTGPLPSWSNDVPPQDDELKTITRLPAPVLPPTTPIVPPPAPASPNASVEAASPADVPRSGLPSFPLPAPGTAHAPGNAAKSSWLYGLLGSASSATSTRASITRATAGTVFAALGLLFALLALVTGLRGAPDISVAPMVAAATVLAHAVVTLGAGALSFVLLRSAERLLVDSTDK